MKTLYLYIIAVIAATSLLSSCDTNCEQGSGNVGTETRKVTSFTKIDVSGGFKVTLKQDSSLAINISADDNLLQYIKTEVKGDELHISTGNSNVCTEAPMEIVIHVKNLNAIELSGAVEVDTEGQLLTKDLDISLSGATKLNLDINAANVHTEGSGATEMNLKGQATSHNLELSGTGKINAFDFVVGSYNISTSGASECDINVLRELIVESSGASTIKYKGNPDKVKNDESGASSLTKVD